MISDEELYRQYLSGDETGLEELIRKYDNPLTLYINGISLGSTAMKRFG